MIRFIDIKRNFKKNKKCLKNKCVNIILLIRKCRRGLSYLAIFAFAAVLIIGSFRFRVTDNYTNILSGVGTGLITSLIVSCLINAENDSREKRKRNEQKKFVLNGIINICLEVYGDAIYKINRFIGLTDFESQYVYGLYEDFSSYNSFEDKLKAFDLESKDLDTLERYKEIFNFDEYQITHLVVELKRLSKYEYYLMGLLTQEECSKLVSDLGIDTYQKTVKTIQSIQSFRNYDTDVDPEQMKNFFLFLRQTIYICAHIISVFPYSRKEAKDKEKGIEEQIDWAYYYEIYLNSEEYMNSEIERAEQQEQYYLEHPEECRRIEEWANRTEEDRTLEKLYLCIRGGFGAAGRYSIDDLLDELDKDSAKVSSFFKINQVQQSLKKNRKARKSIMRKFGENYLSQLDSDGK